MGVPCLETPISFAKIPYTLLAAKGVILVVNAVCFRMSPRFSSKEGDCHSG